MRLHYTFQPKRLPALWQDFQGLLRLCPDRRVEWATPQRVRQVYRWVNGLQYRDRAGRARTFNAIACQETKPTGERSERSWLPSLEVRHATGLEVATQGRRVSWRLDDEGCSRE